MPSLIKSRPLRRKAAPVRSVPGWSYKLADGRYAMDAVTSVVPTTHGDRFSIEFPFAAQLGRDRVGDYLRLAGIRTENHRLNPVSYVDHGTWQPLPIGKTETPEGIYRVWIDEASGLAWAETYLSHAVPEAEQVFELFQERVLRAGSIGYRPLVTQPLSADPMQGWNGGRKEGPLDLIEVELLEASICGLPCNGDAVRRALTTNWAGKSLLPSLKNWLTPLASPKPATSPGVTIMAKKDLPAGGAAPPADAAAPPADGRVPHGAQVTGDVHAILNMALQHIAQEAGVIDNPKVKDHLTSKVTPAIQDMVKGLGEHFAEHYPDLEPLAKDDTVDDSGEQSSDDLDADDDEEPEEPAEGKDLEDDDEEEPEEPSDEKTSRRWNKSVRRKGTPKNAPRVGAKKKGKAQVKRFNKAVHGQIKDAAEFLEEHAGEENLTRQQKTCAAYHARALKDMTAAQEEDPAAAPADDDEMDGDTGALVMKALDNIDRRLGTTETRIKRATGKA